MVAITINSAIPADPGAGLDSTRNSLIVSGALTLSGNYGTGSSHGDLMNLVGAGVASDYQPKDVVIYQEPTAGNAPTSYSFLYGRGATPATDVLIVMLSTSGLEITEGAGYPAALTAATANVRFKATFAKNV